MRFLFRISRAFCIACRASAEVVIIEILNIDLILIQRDKYSNSIWEGTLTMYTRIAKPSFRVHMAKRDSCNERNEIVCFIICRATKVLLRKSQPDTFALKDFTFGCVLITQKEFTKRYSARKQCECLDSGEERLRLTSPNVLYRIKIILLWRQYNKTFLPIQVPIRICAKFSLLVLVDFAEMMWCAVAFMGNYILCREKQDHFQGNPLNSQRLPSLFKIGEM